jgi:hypothetical protein
MNWILKSFTETGMANRFKYATIILLLFFLIINCILPVEILPEPTITPTVVQISKTLVLPEIVTPTPYGRKAPIVTATPKPTIFSFPTPTDFDVDSLKVSTCDQIKIIGDITIPDGMTLNPGQVFVKDWLVSNSGMCSWNSDYRLVLNQGDGLGASKIIKPVFTTPKSSLELSIGSWPPQQFIVKPGQSVDLAIILQAPTQAGTYQGVWSLMNASGQKVEPVFWVAITVSESSTQKRSAWSGQWRMLDPYNSTLLNQPVSFYQTEGQLYSLFYNSQGEMNLIKGDMDSEGRIVKGEFGSPGQTLGNTFMWILMDNKKQFQGKMYFGQTSEGDWCGSQVGTDLPTPCKVVPTQSP